MGRQSRWAFERGALWAAVLDGPAPELVAPRRQADLAEIPPEGAGLLVASMGVDPAVVQRRFAAGVRCFAALIEGRVAAYGWVSQGSAWVGEMERTFRLVPGEVYIWDCVTLPDYRGQRLYTALLSFMLAALRAEGVRRAWIGASLDNQSSGSGIANAGFRPVVWAIYGRLFRLSTLWIGRYRSVAPQEVVAARRIMIGEHERRLGPVVIGIARVLRDTL